MAPKTSLLLSSLLLSAALLACRSADDGAVSQAPEGGSGTSAIAPPLELSGSAYDRAGDVQLPTASAEEGPGLHNVYHLSDSIISGSEPAGRAAFEELAAMGVKTILSVDGAVPDAETAGELGMRYVHVPIQYKDISPDEMIRIAKSFRELQGPFYVHCFHGRHRGPAGAAVGRVVLDGLSRDRAIAEMRQYSGTSSKYEGLYRVIASGYIPGAEESAEYDYEFESCHTPEGMVGVMVILSRAHDNIALLSERAWEPDSEHPDLDALNEAVQLRDAYAVAVDLPEVQAGPVDQRDWFDESREVSAQLVEELKAARAGDSAAGDRAVQAFLTLKADCSACHKAYRN